MIVLKRTTLKTLRVYWRSVLRLALIWGNRGAVLLPGLSADCWQWMFSLTRLLFLFMPDARLLVDLSSVRRLLWHFSPGESCQSSSSAPL